MTSLIMTLYYVMKGKIRVVKTYKTSSKTNNTLYSFQQFYTSSLIIYTFVCDWLLLSLRFGITQCNRGKETNKDN